MKRIFLLAMTMLIFSCSQSLYEHNKSEVQKAREHWVGNTKQDLILAWGQPNNIYSDGKDGEIYNYRRNNGYIVWVTDFYINTNNVIYHLNANSQ